MPCLVGLLSLRAASCLAMMVVPDETLLAALLAGVASWGAEQSSPSLKSKDILTRTLWNPSTRCSRGRVLCDNGNLGAIIRAHSGQSCLR